ncbi:MULTISPECIES: murein transglycosylase domain-containing protein [Helicobacter]|uniref:murein transglycosylase domain-containing protein n=1 Tax=Helicobacter TaxID=209 RepID=UPI000DCF184A|nr:MULTISPECIES: murein transglycosylase domain-containing protein [Helicobacter]MCI7047770.1 murein transglycosylase domain-containing protein [Helicobacter sp.]MCL9823456.1 murein transglycosylase domain-containing protein [Helicobacter colisuis]MDY4427304.1 murein transglycosylase domain-containing protein [Helicobacter sp.]RAX51876.1 lytic murein transglycosylase [Helicobacter sp. 11-8110]
MKSFKVLIPLAFLALFLGGCLLGYRDIIYNSQNFSTEQVVKKVINQAVDTTLEVAKSNAEPTLDTAINALLEEVLDSEQLESLIKNLQANFKKIVAQLTQKVIQNWGKDDAQTASQEVYVKYTDSYLSRAEVDFAKGVILVSTLDTKNPKEALHKAIVTTLLTPDDPEKVDLYSDKEVVYSGTPYLANLVKDNEGKVILYPWRANRYATYLIDNSLKTREIKEEGQKKVVYYVQFDMVADREIQSEHKYGEYVALYAKEYGIEQALIFAIIKTESSFNPYAVSHIPAYGLMQVVPASAGRDVYRALNNKDGIPTKEMLFTPKINIQYGSTYLDILFSRYLTGIKNSLSHEYCVIAAYNTGSGNVLSVFHKDRKKAVEVINSMTSAEVYRKLRTSLKYEEARNYLLKVTNAKKEFQATAKNVNDSSILLSVR